MARGGHAFGRTGPASEGLDQQLRLAIAQKRLVEVRYHGLARIVEPHDYGRHKGVDKVLVYQLRKGGGQHRTDLGWRSFEIAKIEGCRVLDETFPGSRGHDHEHHLAWDIVYARVD
jgi:hypothetical protein